jgi:hypothetical protein
MTEASVAANVIINAPFEVESDRLNVKNTNIYNSWLVDRHSKRPETKQVSRYFALECIYGYQ